MDHEEEQEKKVFHKILDSFRYYRRHSEKYIDAKYREWESLSHKHQSLLPEYHDKLQKTKQALRANADFIQVLVPSENSSADQTYSAQPESEMEKVRGVLRQLARDWSQEASDERSRTYGAIIKELESLFSNCEDKSLIKILVPGAGLGRLAYDIAKTGFSCQGNEFSFYMLLVSNYILNRCDDRNQFVIYPWIHTFSNHLSASDQLRPVRIPDSLPGNLPEQVGFSMTAGDFLEIYSANDENQEWDCVVTCFFIDTAHNVISYLETIYHVLKKGGYWINFGPLLYHFEGIPNESSVELTVEEIILISSRIGFKLKVSHLLRISNPNPITFAPQTETRTNCQCNLHRKPKVTS